ncbi:hypothetical protein GXY_08684 [Novacetimonas hansenii ATCC 23769]|uniref:Uncharacterized protein n=1 Tax=Novacetimonas hansenii ATCC 23769 TaxID=714995 RepID=D5QF21_NOVHA|nr:hypothetical protein GXY_08684 [Novacetimonas hansenii ATCC 23769]
MLWGWYYAVPTDIRTCAGTQAEAADNFFMVSCKWAAMSKYTAHPQ